MPHPETRIPNLKKVLTVKIKEFIAKYRQFATDQEYPADEESNLDENGNRKDDDHHNNDTRYYYQPPSRELYGCDEDKFLDEMLESVIYQQSGSEVVRNLKHVDQVLLILSNQFTFTGQLFGQELSIQIIAPFHKQHLGLRFAVDPLHMDRLLEAAAPRIFYKDVGYFQNVTQKTLVLNNKIAIYYEKKLIYLEDELPPDAIAAIQDLVNQPTPSILSGRNNTVTITFCKENAIGSLHPLSNVTFSCGTQNFCDYG